MFAQFGLMWVAIAAQMCAAAVPSKKSFKKMTKKRPAGAPELTIEEEAQLLEPIMAVRLAIATLIKSMRAAIMTLLTLTKKLGARVQPVGKSAHASASSSSSVASALATSTFLEHKPTIGILQSPEHAQVIQAVLGHIDQSHGHAGANLYALLHSIDMPLHQLKL